MPVVANGSRVQLWYIAEDGNGDIPTPAPNFKPIRFNTDGMSREVTQIDSNEINPARQRPVSRQGTYSMTGEIVGEGSFATHDDLIAAAFQSTFDTGATITAATISAAAADNSFNDSGSGFVAAGFEVGDVVSVTGFTGDVANNITGGIITSVAAGKIVIASPEGDLLVDDTEGESVTITAGDKVRVGSTVPTFAIVERHTDIGIDYVYRRCRVNSFTLAAPLNSPAILTFAMVGEEAEVYTFPGDETFAAATTSEMMVTTQGGFKEADAAIAYLTDYNVTFENNMAPLFSLFQRPAYSVQNGIFRASGSMTAYMPDGALYAKFLGETATDHVVTITEAAQSYVVTLPSVIYTQATKSVDGDGPILPSYTFSAGYDGTLLTTAQIAKVA